MRRALLALVGSLAFVCNTCAPRVPGPPAERPRLDVEDVTGLVPRHVEDRAGWAADVLAALDANGMWPDPPAACAVLAIIEQESGFQANPVVPNLSRIVRRRLEEAAKKLGPLGQKAMRELLDRKAKGERYTFAQRLERVRTERDLDRVFRDLLAYYRHEFPATYAAANLLGHLFTRQTLEDHNPITTAGSMQVSVRFATELARKRGKDPDEVREELYTRSGGIDYGTARLLGYPAGYSEPLHRFADYNAGFYASRNAAVQAQLARVTGRKLTPDGDLLAYDTRGEPSGRDSQSLLALLVFREGFAPSLGEWRIRRDLLEEKRRELEETETYRTLKRVYAERTGETPAYAQVPEVAIRSPKLARERSTAWFARNVDLRYQRCLAQASAVAQL
ncbi:MAG: DUF1615 domain-containing protein [Myxococcaceae bacterium]|nr:DUF1615 domain-containing protein [Myxococcaceae bacterium]